VLRSNKILFRYRKKCNYILNTYLHSANKVLNSWNYHHSEVHILWWQILCWGHIQTNHFFLNAGLVLCNLSFNGSLEDLLIIPFHYSKLLSRAEVNNWHKNVIYMSCTYVWLNSKLYHVVNTAVLCVFTGKWKNIKISSFPVYISDIHRLPASPWLMYHRNWIHPVRI
jgi:hypothetical protein